MFGGGHLDFVLKFIKTLLVEKITDLKTKLLAPAYPYLVT